MDLRSDSGGTRGAREVQVSLEAGLESDFMNNGREETTDPVHSRVKIIAPASGLLPGLPDEVTIDHIIVRLPWEMLSVVFSLNREWQHAITSRQVYDARVRTSSTQSLVVVTHLDVSLGEEKWANMMSICDTSTNKWHVLPLIPGFPRGVPYESRCVSSQGKLYVLGGADETFPFSRNEVHVFDPSGPGRWGRCASMGSPRQAFASGVKDGKIYVFGGIGADGHSEVYDPSEDSWHPIAPMPSVLVEPRVICLDGEFIVHSGVGSEDNPVDNAEANSAEFYNVSNDEWRKIDNFTDHGQREILLDIHGKLHRLYDCNLEFYNDVSKSWEVSKTISWSVLNRKGSTNFQAIPGAAVAHDGELLALVYRFIAGRGVQLVPLKSDGLNLKSKKLVWRKIPCPVPLQWDWLCCLQL